MNKNIENIPLFQQLLTSVLPNSLAQGRGETSVMDKLGPYITAAAAQARQDLTGDFFFNVLEAEESSPLLRELCLVVAIRSWLSALAGLDVVLTPNGFAVISNETLTPASQARTEELHRNLQWNERMATQRLFNLLRHCSEWLTTEQAARFGATLFDDLSLGYRKALAAGTHQEHFLQEFFQLQLRIIDVEDSLAEEWISPELLDALRKGMLSEQLSVQQTRVVTLLRMEVLRVLAGEPVSTRRMQDIVSSIRKSPSVFPQWVGSGTAKLFAPTVFVNSAESGGYFF